MQKKEAIYKKYLDIEDFVPESRQAIIEYICHLCNGVVKHPLIDNCSLGHIFCKECLYIRLSENKLCPLSQEELNNTKFSEIKLVSNIIDKQTVYCKNRIYNCSWIGPLTRLDNHLQLECEKTQVSCRNFNCDYNDFKENLAGHLLRCEFRMIQCSNCSIDVQYNTFQDHLNQCPRVEINCSKNCGSVIFRSDILEHIQNFCDNTLIYCPFYNYGCTTGIQRKYLQDHNIKGNSDHHIMAINTIEKANYELIARISILEKNNLQYKEVMRNTEIAFDKLIEKLSTFYNSIEEEKEIGLKNKRERTEDLEHINNENTNKKRKLKKCSQIQEFDALPKFNDETMNPQKKENELIIPTENNQQENNRNEVKTDKLKKKANENEKITFESAKNELPNKSLLSTVTFDKNAAYNVDLENISKGININMLSVICDNDTLNKYKFAFLNVDIKSINLKWRVKLNVNSTWMAFGICKKELVISNKYKFASNKEGFDHGCFLLSTNGYLWNCNVKSENDKEIKNFPVIYKGDEVSLQYHTNLNELILRMKQNEWKLTQVQSNDNQLVPCFLFLHKSDEATFIIDSQKL